MNRNFFKPLTDDQKLEYYNGQYGVLSEGMYTGQTLQPVPQVPQQVPQQPSAQPQPDININDIVHAATPIIGNSVPQIGKIAEWNAFYQKPDTQTLSALIIRLVNLIQISQSALKNIQQNLNTAQSNNPAQNNPAAQSATTVPAQNVQQQPIAVNASKKEEYNKRKNISEKKYLDDLKMYRSIFEDMDTSVGDESKVDNIQDNSMKKENNVVKDASASVQDMKIDNAHEVTYDNKIYSDGTEVKAKERDQHVILTNPEPFNPDHPLLHTDFSDPKQVIGKSLIKSKEDSQKTIGNVLKSKKEEDDSSDENVNEELTNGVKKFISESVDPDITDIIATEYKIAHGEDVSSISDIINFLKEKYPKVIVMPGEVQKIIRKIQSGMENESEFDFDMNNNENQDAEMETFDGSEENDLSDGDTDDTDDIVDMTDDDNQIYENRKTLYKNKMNNNIKRQLIKAVNEYEAYTDNPDMNISEAVQWLAENFIDLKGYKVDFLNEVKKFYSADNLNDSISDDFYSEEKTLNE